MAAKKRIKIGMKKTSKRFFEKVGALGGEATKKKLGAGHYKKIAILSHASRARNRAAVKAKSGTSK